MGDSETVIRAEGIGKKYVIAHAAEGPARTLRDTITDAARGLGRRLAGTPRGPDARREEFWALKDVSFEIKRGEVVGVIGRNGAGKSTLLKVLSRITEPTTGTIEIDGRVASLLEVGTGFHPELTGRENVFLNGAILGMSRAEIRRKFDEIVAFAEVEKFIDTPVKRYSSGMYMRLAFAVAAHLEPEILIVDEVLAVGDAGFQKKCLDRMKRVSQDGRTVLLVTHNMNTIIEVCHQAVQLSKGQLIRAGAASKVVADYLGEGFAFATINLADRSDRVGSGESKLTRIEFIEAGKGPADMFDTGAAIDIEIDFESKARMRQPAILLAIFNDLGVPVSYFDSGYSSMGGGIANAATALSGTIRCRIPSLDLTPGTYSVNLCLTDGGSEVDHIMSAARLEIVPGNRFGGKEPPPASFGYYSCRHAWDFASTADRFPISKAG